MMLKRSRTANRDFSEVRNTQRLRSVLLINLKLDCTDFHKTISSFPVVKDERRREDLNLLGAI